MNKRQGEQILPDFIEDDLICGFETVINRSRYLSYPVEVSRISQQDEKELGYDGVLTSIVPFYIQFKRSVFYTPSFNGKTMTDRKSLKLSTNKGYFAFNLHLNKKGEPEQHNKLFLLSQECKAIYVAPLFYKKIQLSNYKMDTNGLPWEYRDIEICDNNLFMRMPIKSIRFFHNLISIPPHKYINDLESHSYTYSKEMDICFHSDPEYVRSDQRNLFSYFLNDIISNDENNVDFNEHSDKMIKLIPKLLDLDSESKELVIILQSIINSTLVNRNFDKIENFKALLLDLTPYEKLVVVEEILKKYLGIIQYFKIERIV